MIPMMCRWKLKPRYLHGASTIHTHRTARLFGDLDAAAKVECSERFRQLEKTAQNNGFRLTSTEVNDDGDEE